ncbi:class I SAM-dependent methyltransferase [Thermoflavimicrobium dichotomicum]|uniref:class I SAM-dependent methyltransferase n=1 Tax=Thermoflavimicrobium dichotomicum TaxID=46223 RepID=UPI001587493B|nr:class I SAM-dependent methyltransferase [Thermoflavimicrobium dichotomicum]
MNHHFHFDGRRILDFGSGTGANCSIFSPENYIGVDPDARRIRYAKRLYPGYNFLPLEGHQLPVENQSIDYILIIAVLHHISSEELTDYFREFERVLKPTGTIIVMEPYLEAARPFSNRFMQWFDKGNYIRAENHYLSLFQEQNYDCNILKKFRKCFLYNELFFCACPKKAVRIQ